MATFTVDTDNSGSPDYTSLATAITTEAGIYSAQDVIFNCSGATTEIVTSSILISGYTLDTGYHIIINGDNDTGSWSTSHYRLYGANVELGIIRVGQAQVQINNLQVDNGYTGSTTNRKSINIEASNCDVTDTIIRGTGGGAGARGLTIQLEAATDCTFRKLIIYDFTGGTAVINSNPRYGTANYFDNITVANCVTGFLGNASYKDLPIARNCVTIDCTTGWSGTWDATNSVNNASFDATHIAASGGVDLTSDTITDYFTSTSDFHLDTGATYVGELDDAGTDLSGTFTTDIDGETITDWPIGADAIVSGSSIIPQAAHHYRANSR